MSIVNSASTMLSLSAAQARNVAATSASDDAAASFVSTLHNITTKANEEAAAQARVQAQAQAAKAAAAASASLGGVHDAPKPDDASTAQANAAADQATSADQAAADQTSSASSAASAAPGSSAANQAQASD